jgi:hypothetical protein
VLPATDDEIGDPMNAACELVPATPRFDREAWVKHPNFPHHLLLLGSHKNFRNISKTLVTRAGLLEGEPTPLWRHDTGYLFRWWQSGMMSHEHYEERKLYPYLSQRFCVSLGVLVGDHGEIDELRTVVTKALLEGDTTAIRSALTSFDGTLVRHLADEEDLVIPMLLDLEPEEFRDYSLGRLRQSHSSACQTCR